MIIKKKLGNLLLIADRKDSRVSISHQLSAIILKDNLLISLL